MIRLLGAITGSALALAALLLLVGIPQFKTKSADVERPSFTLPLPSAPVEELQPPEPAVTQDTPEDKEGSDVEAFASETMDIAPPVADESAVSEIDAGKELDIPVLDELPAERFTPAQLTAESVAQNDAMTQWYAFWSPFRSELAATGFVAQLQRVTGLDYRVVKIKPGVYEVAFAYDDDQEIPMNLSQITAATGLQMPEG